MGKELLLKTAGNIEIGNVEFRSNRNYGVLYNMMLISDEDFEPVYHEQGFSGVLWNEVKKQEINQDNILVSASREVEMDVELLREFVSWCNKQSDHHEIAIKLRALYEKHGHLSLDDLT